MNDSSKIWVLVLTGFLTLTMSSMVPVEGGGAGMILFITVPFFIVLGIIFGIVYRLVARKILIVMSSK